MPTFNLRNPSDRAALGLTDGDAAETVPGRSRLRKQGGTGRSRAETESLIMAAVRARGEMTRGEIARLLQVTKSPWLRSIIEDLVSDGNLSRFQRRNRWGEMEWVYR